MLTPIARTTTFSSIVRSFGAVSLLLWLGHSGVLAQQPPPSSSGSGSTEEGKLRDEWRMAMGLLPLPKKGCFQGTYPNKEWREVTCVPGPNYPIPPRHGVRPLVVGNGDDVSAEVPSGFIQSAIGSFDSVTNVTSETSAIGSGTTQVANAYTLQLNTNPFTSTVCNSAANPAVCQGWEQFVFENTGTIGRGYIQYWILRYNKACPAGQSWNQFSFTGDTDIYCWKNNSGGTVSVGNKPITSLGSLSLTGSVSSTMDSVTVADGTNVYARTGDNAVNASAGWTIAEFNVFGDGGSSSGGNQATFNSGADIVARSRINYGERFAPICSAQGFTAETNNLSFGPSAPMPSQPGPAVIFREGTAGGATSNCAAAVTVGDTHLMTFNGLFYDFQSQGDFLLLQSGSSFQVQARQVSSAPTWPNASTNSAVATQIGSSKVALCAPDQLFVDGQPKTLADGASLSTTGGADIWRHGNIYFVTGASGDSIRATMNTTYIDVSVGLGRWPVAVKGLLANPAGNVNQLEARDGTVLTNPFNFTDLYQHYGKSWRVPASESLLSACGAAPPDSRPSKPFFAPDLDRAKYSRNRAVCETAGVRGEPLLDACTLDIAVIGNDAAAKVLTELHQPIAVGKIVFKQSKFDIARLWWVILLLIILVGSLWFFRRRRP
jgi:hypothetical protein